MFLKKSVYNIEVDRLDKGDILIFNSLTSAFGIMNCATQELYNGIENINIDSITEKSIKENIDVMKSNGFLVNEDIDEFERIKLLSRFARYKNNNLSIAIAPTMNCNMACPYCYEDKTSHRINTETKELLIKFIENYIVTQNIKYFSVTWYGGEPLLELKTIQDISKEFIDICKKSGAVYNSGIITNGSLLDYTTAKLLIEECNVSRAQITIDGFKETHNKRRILKNGLDSFQIIIDNIDSIKDILPIVVRINVDKSNADEISNMINYFITDKGWKNTVKFYLSPVFARTNETYDFDSSFCLTEKEFSEIDTWIINDLSLREDSNILGDLYPKSRLIYCGALKYNFYAVDPNGYLYTCWENVGKTQLNVGNVKDGVLFNKNFINWLTTDLPNNCMKCNMLPLCQGGCPHNRISYGVEPKCEHIIFNCKENLKAVYKNYRKTQGITNAI